MHVTYGSKLYGTSTPKSDTDDKVIYIPSLDSLLLGQKSKIFKIRLDATGNKVPDMIDGKACKMPDNGVETEYIPIQTFVRHFVRGQTYALEVAHAYLSFGPPKPGLLYTSERPTYDFVKELVARFTNAEVHSMVGFAAKQTMDYVMRGGRMNKAQAILDVLVDINDEFYNLRAGPLSGPRLDTQYADGTILDAASRLTGLSIGSSMNNNKTMRTLEMNGRSYGETTTLEHLIALLQKKVSGYGERTQAASTVAVDFKSLSHAVRVYQQCIELLDTGKMTFPRPNAAELLKIKTGQGDLEAVKQQLRDLDAEVLQKIETTTLQKRTPELDEEAEVFLLNFLRDLYSLASLND